MQHIIRSLWSYDLDAASAIQNDRDKMSDEKPAFPEAKQDGMQFMVDILHKLGSHLQ